jgi:hypothetical protein
MMVYGLAAACTVVSGYLAWRKIRPHRDRYHCHQNRNGHHKGCWGVE